MTVSELINTLKRWPDQQARVIFTFASEIDGSLVVREVSSINPRTVRDDNGRLDEYGTSDVNVAEII